MDYLIYDQDGELIDVLNFKTHKDYDAYKAKNPNAIILKAEDIVFEEDNDDLYDDYEI